MRALPLPLSPPLALTPTLASARSSVVAALLLGIVAAFVPPASAERPLVQVEDETNLSSSSDTLSEQPTLAVTDDGTVHAVWEEGSNVVHRYRTRGVGVWSARQIVFRQGYDPAVATDGSTIVIAFVRGKRDASDDTEILYKMWDREAQRWPLLAEQVQSGEENIAADGQQPDVAFSIDGSYLWLAWIDTTWGDQQPYYARIRLSDHAVDAGPIDSHSRRAQGPALFIGPEDTVHVAWGKYNEFTSTSYIVHASRAAQAVWDIDDYPYHREVKQARSPDIQVTQNQWCMTWHENISIETEGTPQANNEIVLWCNDSNWNISNSRDHSLTPRLALDDDRGQLVVWRENVTPREIVFRQGPPPPAQGSSTVREGEVDSPDVAYASGYAHSVWSAATDVGSDIWYAKWPVAMPTPTSTPSATNTPSATRTPTATGTSAPEATIYLPNLTVTDERAP